MAVAPQSELARLYQEGLRLHQAGQLAAAEACYRRILAQQDGHVDTQHLLAVCLHARGDFAQAGKLLNRALRSRPDLATLHVSHGNVQRETGQLAEAIKSYERAARLDPKLAIAHYNLGTALEEAGRLREALAAYDLALSLSVTPGALGGRGNCLVALGRAEEAIASYRQSLQIDPRQAEVVANLGAVLKQQGHYAQADQMFAQALSLQPQLGGSTLQKATVLNDLGRPQQALSELDAARARGEPLTAETVHQRARALWLSQRAEEAIRALADAHRMAPDHWTIRFDLAAALVWRSDRMAEAMAHLDHLEAERPGDLGVKFNRAKGLHTIGEFAPARALLDEVIAQQRATGANPGLALFSLSMVDLIEGRFEAGWRAYESRWDDPANRVRQRSFSQPLWLGDEGIGGATLLVHAEQGFGDTLQFVRYLPWLASLGAQVVLEVPSPLRSLVARMAGGRAQVVDYGGPLPHFDRHIPMMSLPHASRTTLERMPPAEPYLGADPERVQTWTNRLSAKGLRRVGLAWSGNPGHQRDHERSIPLQRLVPVLDALREASDGAVEFLSLQNHLRVADRETWAGIPDLLHFGAALGDFDDTAALVALCDLVICVDTAAGHLAGAMGKPTWVLLQHVPDWRWMLEREDSPWYPSLRLFRQQRLGDWDAPLAQLASAARSWVRTTGEGA